MKPLQDGFASNADNASCVFDSEMHAGTSLFISKVGRAQLEDPNFIILENHIVKALRRVESTRDPEFI
ncbi:hypothetical protein ZIOFF_053779 [Zingiber officinale]|uniref:Uncharacterized protein n=1 Tax=Zingiber officinale TaxID=94328 RepID=A0A8J5FTB8_ZINOF|nr:hypothetical protein ZIOFF_053779 [Zingiber officinale]